MSEAPPGTPSRRSPLIGLAILCVVNAAVITYLILTYSLGVSTPFAGFLLLLYWGGVDHFDLKKLAPDLSGALLGVLIAEGVVLAPAYGMPGIAAITLVVVATLYAQIMGWLKIAVNLSTMLFLTVGTIPGVLSLGLGSILSAILLSAIFFGGLATAIRFRHRLRAYAKSSRQPLPSVPGGSG